MIQTLDNATSAAAGAALTSPLWLPVLEDMSSLSALLLPILGAIWLIVQIIVKMIERKERRRVRK
jgi:flagellar biogenesis protein FliO